MGLPPVRNTKDMIPEWVTGIVYSQAKLGKTTTVHKTMPQPSLTLATEDGETQGLQSIRDQGRDFLEIRDWGTFELVHSEMMKKTKLVDGKYIGECQYLGTRYDNVIVDSYSCCGHLWMDKALSSLGWTEIGLGRGRAGLQPYSYIAEKGRQTTKRLMMLRANVVVIAREGVYETGMGTDQYTCVPCIELPGAKLIHELPGSFDFILRMKTVAGQRVFVTTEEGGAMAGIRVPEGIGAVPRYVLPNISDIIALVKGDKDAIKRLTIEKAKATPPAVAAR